MLYFKPLELTDKEVLNKFLTPYPFYLSTYSFTNLYMWRKICDIKFVVLKDCLIILKKDFNNYYHFLEPININEGNFKYIIESLVEYAIENKFLYIFKDITSDFISKLKLTSYGNFVIAGERESFEYIYRTTDLINLKGNKYKSQRNHYNHFSENENFAFSEISEINIHQVNQWLNHWKPSLENKTSQIERNAILELLNNYSNFGLKGMLMYVDGEVEGFTIGEKIKNDMVIVHAEKANHNINGIYSYINREFLKLNFENILYVNREEDLGIKGLRSSKLAYIPLWLEPSYSVFININ